MKKKIIYVPLAVDILHTGHLNLLKKAKKYGDIVIGLLSDKAIVEYKSLPLISYDERFEIVNNLKNVYKVIEQDEWDYTNTLKQLKPDFFIHGDDWKTGIQKKIRLKVIKTLKSYGGKLIEIPYTSNISSTIIKDRLRQHYTPASRVSLLKRLIDSKNIVRLLESHNALTGLIVEETSYEKSNIVKEFDAMWSSSLTDSTSRGKPDNQSVDFSSRFLGLSDILDVTKKPVLFDADNGGRIEHIPYTVKTLERYGVSGLMIEDKVGLKKNSLFKDQGGVKLDRVSTFCSKIKAAKKAAVSKDFLVGARIESFIVGNGLNDALKRAEAYSKAGADLILIHSKESKPHQIFSFAKKFIKSKYYKPMVAVPSTYSSTTEAELIKNGFKVVIYANHLIRAAHPAMVNVAKNILKNGRSFEVEKKISSIKEIIELI